MRTYTIAPIQAFKDNYIWMLNNEKEAWVVDPGDSAPVIEVLQKQALTLSGILLTHHHADHSGGIPGLVNYVGTIPVFSSLNSPVSAVTHRVKEGGEINSPFGPFKALEIPGHTLDHIAFYGEDALFCGDTLFSAGCGRVFEGTHLQMFESLSKINNLATNTQIYCGHEYTLANLYFAQAVEPGNEVIAQKIEKLQEESNICSLPSSLAEEKNINPFLRCHVSSVIHAAEQHVNRKLTDSVEVFSVLREWKNTFK